MTKDRTEYQRAYYEANKARKKALRKSQPRTEGAKAAEARYMEKQRVLREIDALPVPTIDGDTVATIRDVDGALALARTLGK
jgi:hypothetical protein